MSITIEVCILAAGLGSRMKSDKAKVLQTLAGRPLLDYLLEAAGALNPAAIHVVIGQGADQVRAAYGHRDDINWVFQSERLGTGHAMQQVSPNLGDDSRVLVMLGDCPLIKAESLRSLTGESADLAVLTVDMPDPSGYGRIVRDENGQILAIVEEKDTSDSQKAISEINTGLMAADAAALKGWLARLDADNAQQEYLLTDIVLHANDEGRQVSAFKVGDPTEVSGVNTFAQLADLERRLQMDRTKELMERGVQVMDPARLDIRGVVTTGRGVSLDINVILEGEVELGDEVEVGPNCIIKDSKIEAGALIRANSIVEEAVVGAGSIIGPYARLRPGAELAEEVHIGNFVEVKKSSIGRGSKANHLAYLGDATIGCDVNIGAGTITCNYDGANKHQTTIGDRVFVGTNTSLVAPVELGEGSTTGAGSTITRDVEEDALAITRVKQTSVSNWKRPTKKK